MSILSKSQLALPVASHFLWGEMVDVPARDVPPAAQVQLKLLCLKLEVLRALAGDKPISINSGFRDREANTATGGADNSYHMKGMAADISHASLTPAQLGAIARSGWKGVIVYPSHVHVDLRPTEYHALGVYK